MVVACDRNRGIGANNQLPWRLPGDMKHFRTLTTGDGKQNATIMGRNTWESIAPKFRPLANRLNIILTRADDYPVPLGVWTCKSLDDALAIAKKQSTGDCFVIGGAKVYDQAISHSGCRRLYITELLAEFACDVFFPLYKERFKLSQQSPLHEENGIQYRFEVYESKE